MTTFEYQTGPIDTDYAISAVEKRFDLPVINQNRCTYPILFELITPQPFMTIDDKTGEIAIQTDDRDHDQTYSVEVKASITVPIDFSNTETKTLESIYTFDLKLYVPMELCSLSKLDEITLTDMETSVLGESMSQSFDEVQDLESKNSGDKSGLTFCGPRLYEIVGTPAYI